jgi:hypothetical protein
MSPDVGLTSELRQLVTVATPFLEEIRSNKDLILLFLFSLFRSFFFHPGNLWYKSCVGNSGRKKSKTLGEQKSEL